MPESVLVIGATEFTERWLRSYAERRRDFSCTFTAAAEAMAQLPWPQPSAILVQVQDAAEPGLATIQGLHSKLPAVPIIAVLESVQPDHVAQVIEMGAVDYLAAPLTDADLERALRVKLGARTHERNRAVVDNPWHSGSAHHPRIRRIRDIALRAASTDVPVLVFGESGVGKEVLAQYIHENSLHCRGPFVRVNCAAIPADLLESELFGHERGAFTGAGTRKPGMFALANDGTIMLDEVGELAGSLQAKLLHVLQDGQYMRLGGTVPVHTNARILAATNRPLEAAVMNGEFRQDLFFRLNVVQIEIPPLRDRLGDLPVLCSELMAKHAGKYSNGPLPVLTERLMDAFLAYSWPGNIRQLENLIKQFVIFRDESVVLDSMKEAVQITSRGAAAVPVSSQRSNSLRDVGADAADRAEKELVMGLLEERGWNRKQVARDLQVSYKTLLMRLQRWQIPRRAASASREI